ncbi:MAG: ABC-F family ATP-binding cassette domain-containing protein [Bacteroidota bacterium]
MITASNIYVQYGDRILLNNINVVIQPGEKIGLVGRNGAGKSTLLKIIAGDLSAQAGNVARPSNSTLGFLYQEMDLPKGKRVMEETLTAFEDLRKLEVRIEEINQEMAHRTDYESDSYMDLLNEFSEANDRFQLLGGDAMQANAERVLKGLGFEQSDFDRLTDEFSGGWQMRIELAKMLLQQPDYLLLDEPTNHLDIESIIWLEKFLQTYSGAIITISHDKEFLNNTTKRTVEVELGRLYDYKAAYSKYVELKAERREKMQATYSNQQKVIAQKERTINRFMAKATKTKMAQSMQKQLDKLERVEVADEDVATMNIRFAAAPRSGQIVVAGKDLVKSYGSLNVLDGVDFKVERGERVAFVGQNGQGKSTLAKIIVQNIDTTDGTLQLGHNVQIGYYAQNQSDTLGSNFTLLETMERYSPPELRPRLRNILGAFMFSGEDVDKKVSVLSGGERARLALACLLLNPFNLLVLDEPTNHLDMLSKAVLKNALLNYDGTLIVVSHDRDFLAGLTDHTLEFRNKQLYPYLGDVNYFLEKRALDDMRSVELQGSNSNSQNSEKSATKPTISREERKQLMKAVSQAEKKVERLEDKIAAIEQQMADESFYAQADSEQILKQYSQLKKDLDTAMETWEVVQLEWEEYE